MASRTRTLERLYCNAHKELCLVPPEMQEHSKTERVHNALQKHFSDIPFVTVNHSCNGLQFAAPSLEKLFLSGLKVKACLKAQALERDVCLV